MSQEAIRSALEVAIDSMSGIIPASVILKSVIGSPAIVETTTPHGLSSNLTVNIVDHVASNPSLNRTFKVLVVDQVRVSLKDVVTDLPIKVLAAGVAGSMKANLTSWDNVSFEPVSDVPYQRVNVLFGKPQNPSFGGDHVRENGFMQVTLFYPKNRGTHSQSMRAKAIRAIFKRGATFEKDGIIVNIPNTPEVMPGTPEDDSYATIVRVPFWADVFV